MPAKRCLCGKALQRIVKPRRQKSEDALLAIDSMAVDLLQGKCVAAIEPGLIPMHARGYMQRTVLPERVHVRKETTALLDNAIGSEGLQLLNIGGSTVSRLLGELHDGQYLINPRQNTAFAYAVFGDWQGLKEEVDLRRNDVEAYLASSTYVPKRVREVESGRTGEISKRLDLLNDEQLAVRRQEARAFIEKVLAEHPSITRRKLIKMKGGKRHFYFAFYKDSDWFSRVMPARTPSQRKALAALQLSKQAHEPSKEEIQMANRIYARCDQLLRTKPLERITRARLLNNTRNESVKGWAEKSPTVREALDVCVDSPEEYTERRIGYVCEKVREISLFHPYGSKNSYRGLSERHVKFRLNKAMKWLRKHSR
ncbi:hypothetical protein P9239_19335 [Caballeronia sp. LZ062]|uniref:hypothetical protein n=1 Tax=unclassified Caballeronia TaxID=2646786 RepID=UPI002857AE5A|nr:MULTISPECIES: hypothetical protein [unclassified Caballeronia]MDR5855706.1 hypothetical protein [Caballeronia sp. LZ050]MDR5872506.1 hypothetical protein [Caballeronia sp. LZ062]